MVNEQEISLTTAIWARVIFYFPILVILSLGAAALWGPEIAAFIRRFYKSKDSQK